MGLSQIYGRSPCCGPGGAFYSPCLSLSCPSTTGAAGVGTVDTAVQLLPLPWGHPDPAEIVSREEGGICPQKNT